MKLNVILTIALVVSIFAPCRVAAQNRPLSDLFMELDNYPVERARELQGNGKRIDPARRAEIDDERKALASKYAAEAASRTDLQKNDFYYLGRLYGMAGNDTKLLESMKRFLADYPASTKGDMIQSARAHIIALSSQRKIMMDAEAAFALWKAGSPVAINQQPALQDHIALGYYKSGDYDMAVKHAQEAFEILKTFKAKTLKDKRDREQLYMNLTEVLAMSYRKNKNSAQALSTLAEARAESFAIPSAELYRKVMDFVEGSGFSEKKLMQKVDSYALADPAPEMAFAEWIGHDPIALEHFRGRVVLLDFWATWCGPCISTFPRLRSWYKKYGGDDFIIVGVTQYYGEQGGRKMTKLQELDFLNEFKAKYKLPYPFAIAGPAEARMKYGINAFPTTVLLDRRGVVRYIRIGACAEDSENLEDTIEKVISAEGNLASAAR
jgi:thiol-disulfide isomerase/thioredoxin